MRIAKQPGVREQDQAKRRRRHRNHAACRKRKRGQTKDQHKVEIAVAKPARARRTDGIGDKGHDAFSLVGRRQIWASNLRNLLTPVAPGAAILVRVLEPYSMLVFGNECDFFG